MFTNQVIFIKNGEIAEQGTHEELMAKKVRMARHSAFLNLFIFFKSQSGLYASMATFDAKRNVDKGNSKRSRLGGENINIFFLSSFPKNQQVLYQFSFWPESTSLSTVEEEAAVQKDLKEESSGNGEVFYQKENPSVLELIE